MSWAFMVWVKQLGKSSQLWQRAFRGVQARCPEIYEESRGRGSLAAPDQAALKLHHLSEAERPQRFPVHGELFKAWLLVELLQALEEG